MSEPAEDLRSLDSQPYAEAASDRSRSEFLNSWAQHLSTTDSPPIDESTGIQRMFLAHDTIVDYKPVEATKRSFALGADYLTAGNHRSFTERLEDFAQAATHRLADPKEQRGYIQEQIDTVTGIDEGLNNAKEDAKSTVATGLQTLTNGTALRFMAQPNAVNNAISYAATDALNAIPKNPNSARQALQALGNSTLKASNRFSMLPPRERGKLLGEMMFAGFVPESGPEAAEGELI